MPTSLLRVAEYSPKNEARVYAGIGIPAGIRAVIAAVGCPDWNPVTMQKEMDRCAADGVIPDVWFQPGSTYLDKQVVDLDGLANPNHPHVKAAHSIIEKHKGWVVVSYFSECADRISHNPPGPYRYRSGAFFRYLFDAVSSGRPINAIPVWSYMPDGQKINFAEWEPHNYLARGVSLYGVNGFNPSKPAHALLHGWASYDAKPFYVREGGPMLKDGTPSVSAYFAPYFDFCETYHCHAAAIFDSTSFGMTPWAHLPECASYVRSRFL